MSTSAGKIPDRRYFGVSNIICLVKLDDFIYLSELCLFY